MMVQPASSRWVPAILRLGAALGVAVLLWWATGWAMNQINTLDEAVRGPARSTFLALALLAYALLIAIPFVPAIEIGLGLLMLGGAPVAPYVYLATLAGLLTAFFVGHLLPLSWIEASFRLFRLRAAADMTARLAPLSHQERLDILRHRLPGALGTWAIRFRHLTLAVLLNIPGNALVGGGGGIALVAGLSRLFTPRAVVLTLALAILPVPLAVWFWGAQVVTILPADVPAITTAP